MSLATKIEKWICRVLRMPTCQELETNYYDYLARALDPPSRRRVERHLMLCKRCRKFFESYRKIVKAVASLPSPTLDELTQKKLVDGIFVRLKS